MIGKVFVKRWDKTTIEYNRIKNAIQGKFNYSSYFSIIVINQKVNFFAVIASFSQRSNLHVGTAS